MIQQPKIPLISVVMSIYSEPHEWLKESIESILNQTFTDFEFIIINDNPERKLNNSLLNEYKENDSRIVIIKNEKNIGLTKSLNKGLKRANGKYIARMDGDDISLPTRFNDQLLYMEHNPDTIVCGTYIEYFGAIKKKKIRWINEKNIDLKNRLYSGNCFAHPSVFIRKKILTDLNLFYDENFKQSQDYKLWSDLRNYGDFYTIPKLLLKYRISNAQIRVRNKQNQHDSAYKIRKSHIENFINKFLNQPYCYPKRLTIKDYRIIKKIERELKDTKTTTAILNSHIENTTSASFQIIVFLILNLILFREGFNNYELLRLIKRTLLNR